MSTTDIKNNHFSIVDNSGIVKPSEKSLRASCFKRCFETWLEIWKSFLWLRLLPNIIWRLHHCQWWC